MSAISANVQRALQHYQTHSPGLFQRVPTDGETLSRLEVIGADLADNQQIDGEPGLAAHQMLMAGLSGREPQQLPPPGQGDAQNPGGGGIGGLVDTISNWMSENKFGLLGAALLGGAALFLTGGLLLPVLGAGAGFFGGNLLARHLGGGAPPPHAPPEPLPQSAVPAPT
ncbi:MAG: hypothetical protein AAF654_05000 [Myxococcota bacterium]